MKAGSRQAVWKPGLAARLPRLAVLAATLVLCACGDGGTDEQASAANGPNNQPSAPDVPNKVPSISGSPPGSVVAGQAYTFTPTASDGDGDILTFSVTGKPAWAAFDVRTGQLSGTPSQADIGSSSSIAIRVTDGAADSLLAAFTLRVVATAAGSATITWLPPTQNTDGSSLTNLAGYKVYWGTDPVALTSHATVSNSGLTSYVVEGLTPAKWYFATSAFNAAGVESQRSNIASKTVL